MERNQWRRCNACKGPIEFEATYWVCSVSTCNRKRTGLAFCSVSCWDVHLPGANHREAWALERTAPRSGEEEAAPSSAERRSGTRRLVRGPTRPPRSPQPPQEILIVATRLKEYVRALSGFNTSDGVLEPLSEIVRRVCEEAIRNARSEGRRTILERDVPDPS